MSRFTSTSLLILIALCFALSPSEVSAQAQNPAPEIIIKPKGPTFGYLVKGGAKPTAAIEIGFNTDYKLSHNQQKGQLDYFYIDADPTLALTLELKTFGKDLVTAGGTTDTPYAGIQLIAAGGQVLRALEIDGVPNQIGKALYIPPVTGRYYVAIGSVDGATNRHQVGFKVNVMRVALMDMDCSNDAGHKKDKAQMIAPAQYLSNCLGGKDTQDVFGFWGRAGEEYVVQLTAQDGATLPMSARIFGEDNKVHAQGKGKRGIKLQKVKIPSDGNYFLEVRLESEMPAIAYYTLDLKKL